MSSDAIAIRVRDVSKHYLLFERPQDRLKQMIVPRLQRLAGRPPRPYYRDFASLSGVSFEVKRGETVGIIGRNGSGKSTLLQIVCGTLRPTHGSVEVQGRIAALLELGAGFNPDFTGRENVYVNGAILGLSSAEIDARFDAIARFADIGDFIEQPVKTYSSGMYVRLAFATAISVDPDILVVDEALAVGDEAFQRKCYARIEEIQAKGSTVLFVSHGAQTIVQLCSRALLFDAGELILDGQPKTVVSQYQRLVNLGGTEAKTVREQIRSLPIEETGRPTATDPAVNPSSAAGAGLAQAHQTSSRPARAVASLEGFDQGLQTQSRVDYESQGARIRDCKILTLGGKQVNVLETGRYYLYEFHADFSVTALDVGFGTMLKTMSGIELGGTSSDLVGLRLDVKAGDSACVQFKFQCNVFPGVYFLNAGLGGNVDGEDIMLHRVMDALPFRVAANAECQFSGPVDFGFAPKLEATRSTGEKVEIQKNAAPYGPERTGGSPGALGITIHTNAGQ